MWLMARLSRIGSLVSETNVWACQPVGAQGNTERVVPCRCFHLTTSAASLGTTSQDPLRIALQPPRAGSGCGE
ncbi:uncharacterized protein B0H18DRAFT_131402 [Fomitopsis serialis]|uniref:uncharacterized protein n=1 Tax=Fomitopsis serialis TaxID=139415 RepID=UPI0020081FDB|nr:uncharacterized protein B0H18DRAFT_131402 [Neoantrodia serialis]KAH9930655.1 hypothetical protein B0H18DRAFT_131402 [Neoantrodia serialis]